MADKQLILAFFADEPAAETAAMTLKDSGVAESDAIGILVLDDTGNVVDKVGATSVARSMNGVTSRQEGGGLYHALIGTLEIVAIATVIALPIGSSPRSTWSGTAGAGSPGR